MPSKEYQKKLEEKAKGLCKTHNIKDRIV